MLPGRVTQPAAQATPHAAPARTTAPRPASPASPPASPASPNLASPPPDTYCRSGVPVRPPATVPTGPRERERLLEDMMRDLPADSPIRARAQSASGSFSTPQLRRMQEAGVRFANDDALPCERVLEGSQASQRLGGLGRYLPEARTIQVRDGVSTGEVMHEMAHAWDDVRNDRVRMRDDLSAAQRADQQLRFNHQDAAGRELRVPAARRHAELRGVAPAFHSDNDPGINAAYDAYQGRFARGQLLREGAFDLGAEGHSRDNPREFYAEGFRVFHQDAGARDRLIRNAPELYRILYDEARRDGTLPSGAPPPPARSAP